MQQTSHYYNVALAKGHGLYSESIALLQLWQPGMNSTELVNLAIQQGVLSRATAKRVKDIIAIHFANRYLIENGKPAKQIKILLADQFPGNNLNQIFLIHTARANPILHDFIVQVFWPYYSAGKQTIAKEDALLFLEKSRQEGRIKQPWAPSIISRISTGLIRCLADFDMADQGRKNVRRVLPGTIKETTVRYLLYDLHFSGFNDNGILDHEDWQLFGLQKADVVNQLLRCSGKDFILQYSGDLARFTWSYSTIEEAFHVIATTQL